MIYLGDYADDATVDFMWSTNAADGASITRATNGTISVYKGNSTTQTTTGVTDTEDFDSLTGIHHCRIATTDAFYATGNDYMVVLSAATIDGETVNAVLALFSIQNRYNPTPPTAAAIADAVWDESASAHTSIGSTGEALNDAAAGAVSAADIADAVWDESLGAHLSVGSTGDALNDAGGSAADPWDTALPGAYTSGKAGWILGTRLDAQVSSISGNSPGAGANEWTYTLTETGSGDPIADADVWVTTDAPGTNVVASGRTDQTGEITFYLDSGTVYVWRQKSGYNFTNPDTEVVA
jgi:hypothetical protein